VIGNLIEEIRFDSNTEGASVLRRQLANGFRVIDKGIWGDSG
jgi:hypothetical protein